MRLIGSSLKRRKYVLIYLLLFFGHDTSCVFFSINFDLCFFIRFLVCWCNRGSVGRPTGLPTTPLDVSASSSIYRGPKTGAGPGLCSQVVVRQSRVPSKIRRTRSVLILLNFSIFLYFFSVFFFSLIFLSFTQTLWKRTRDLMP